MPSIPFAMKLGEKKTRAKNARAVIGYGLIPDNSVHNQRNLFIYKKSEDSFYKRSNPHNIISSKVQIR